MKKEELVRAVLDRVAQAEREKEAELLRAGEKLLARILKLKPDLAQYEPKATTNGEVYLELPACAVIEVGAVGGRVQYRVGGDNNWWSDLDVVIFRAYNAMRSHS